MTMPVNMSEAELSALLTYFARTKLFDEAFYTSQYGSRGDAPPALEFYLDGYRHGRKPNPMFDPAWYLTKYPDVKAAGINPLFHYVAFGEAEGRWPCAEFEPDWYRHTYRVPAGLNALAHYLTHRFGDVSPNPGFDVRRYKSKHPEIDGSGLDAFQHFLSSSHSSAETQASAAHRAGIRDALGVALSDKMPGLSVVVPVYNAPEDVQACLRSIAKNFDIESRIVVIDDCSSDPQVRKVLAEFRDDPRFKITRNRTNLGYTRTVNSGIAVAANHDVIILNSDTVTTPFWARNLRAAAYSSPNIASATACSNNAGAFSVPEMNADNPLPEGWSVDDMARLVRQASLGNLPIVPTGNGFCMYLRRDALQKIGTFDEAAFPVGYGEENDFCMRAVRAGFEHVCDTRTYVYHRRSSSFGGRKGELLANGRAVVDARYPEYKMLLSNFVSGQMEQGRSAVETALARLNGSKPKPRIAYFISTTTGGTPQTNRDLMEAFRDDYDTRLVRCDGQVIHISWLNDAEEACELQLALSTRIDPLYHRSSEYEAKIAQWLIDEAIELIHIRHLAWHSLQLPGLAKRLGIPVIFSIHDFYAICPTTKLLDNNMKYCGGTCTEGEGLCVPELWSAVSMPNLKHGYVHHWRARFLACLEPCDAFVTTSDFARSVFLANFSDLPAARMHVIEHGRDLAMESKSGRYDGGPMRVLVPGNISSAKGADLIRAAVEKDRGRTVEFHVLGKSGRLTAAPGLVLHGEYRREQFAERVGEIGPQLGAVLSIWPETYCHTLTEMWACGLPVLGIDVGAVGERIRRHGGGWLLALGEGLNDRLLEQIGNLRFNKSDINAQRMCVERWQEVYGSTRTTKMMASEYRSLYETTAPHLR